MGSSPFAVYGKMISTIFSLRGLTRSIEAGLPLMFTGLAVALGYRMNLNNIGADGQYALGAIFCVGVGLYGPPMPARLKIIVMFAAAMLGGALAALIAAVPRALWNVSETILTMMLNYVFLNVLNYLMYGPWKELNQMVAQTREIDSSLWLPEFGNTGISLALLIAFAIAFLAYLNPLSTVLVAFLLGALQISAVAVQITGVPSQVATMIQGSIMLFVIAGEFFIRYRLVKVQKGEAA